MKRDIHIRIMIALLMGFGLAIYIENIRFEKKSKNWITVEKPSALKKLVSDVYLNHGDLVFNDTFYINAGNLKNSTSELLEIWQMETPFYLTKEPGNDTFVISRNGEKRYLVLE